MPKTKRVKVDLKKKNKGWRSGFEGKIAKNLTAAGIPYEYEVERLKYTVPEQKKTYTPDFTTFKEVPGDPLRQRHIVIEAKGIFDRESRTKMEEVIKQHPDRDIRMLFMRDNKIAKNSKTKYSDWCKQRGIKFAISYEGKIPEQWIADMKQENKNNE